MCIYIHIYTYVCVYVYVYIYVCVCVYVCVCAHTCVFILFTHFFQVRRLLTIVLLPKLFLLPGWIPESCLRLQMNFHVLFCYTETSRCPQVPLGSLRLYTWQYSNAKEDSAIVSASKHCKMAQLLSLCV